MEDIGRNYRLRILLVLVDDEENVSALRDLNKISFSFSFTLILSFSNQEAARYLETYKAYEKKSASLIQEKEEVEYLPKVTKALSTIKGINKADVIKLLDSFGNLKGIANASEKDLLLCPGMGEKKVKRLFETFHEPFSKKFRISTSSSSSSFSSATSATSSSEEVSSSSSSSSISNMENTSYYTSSKISSIENRKENQFTIISNNTYKVSNSFRMNTKLKNEILENEKNKVIEINDTNKNLIDNNNEINENNNKKQEEDLIIDINNLENKNELENQLIEDEENQDWLNEDE